MEYLSGGDLRNRIPKGGMKESEALSYVRQIADALMFVHDRNILHLDIKPSNVLFRSNGEAVLVDFGLSKHYDEVSGDQTSSTPLGISEGYAPTEQYECGGVSSFSPATDIYSLGATFYCLLQGNRPPKASIVLNDGLPVFPSHVSLFIRKAIETAMHPKRNDRPQSVAAFLSLLDASVENVDEGTVIDVVSSEASITKPSFLRNKWFIPLVFCLLTALCVFGFRECCDPVAGGEDTDTLFVDTLVHVDTINLDISRDALKKLRDIYVPSDTISVILPKDDKRSEPAKDEEIVPVTNGNSKIEGREGTLLSIHENIMMLHNKLIWIRKAASDSCKQSAPKFGF
jgi:serine/threonine protein kinase